MSIAPGKRAPRRLAHVVFFPAAAVYGALLPPLSLAVMTGLAPPVPGLLDGLGHAHEMLFGFALAVVAGYLLGPQPGRRLSWLLALWLAGRVGFLAAPANLLSALVNAGFALTVAALVAPKFLGAAKKMRNQAFAPVLVGISAMASLAQIARLRSNGTAGHLLMLEAVLLFALLALFMGGRIIAAAAAGQRYQQGENMNVRVQPRLEGALMLGLGLAVLLLPLPAARLPTALLLAACALVAAARLLRWRLWQCHGRPDLTALAVGYGWLAAGLGLLAAALLTDQLRSAALHAITVGGLGSLMLGVMARVAMLRTSRDPAHSIPVLAGAGLLSAAALARVAAGLPLPVSLELLWVSAGCWGLAFAMLATLLARLPGTAARSPATRLPHAPAQPK